MKRRKFIEYSAGAGIFLVGLDLIRPQQAEAFLFALLRGGLIDLAASFLVQGAFALARGAFSQRSQAWYDNRLDAQLAQREFLARRFTNVQAAEIPDAQYRYIVGAESFEQRGYNPAFSFTQMRNSTPSTATYGGPFCLGMAIAAQHLSAHGRMTPQEVKAAIIPRYQEYADSASWSVPTSQLIYPTTYSDSGVRIRYDAIDLRSSGRGTIEVVVNANRRIEIPLIEVQYA